MVLGRKVTNFRNPPRGSKNFTPDPEARFASATSQAGYITPVGFVSGIGWCRRLPVWNSHHVCKNFVGRFVIRGGVLYFIYIYILYDSLYDTYYMYNLWLYIYTHSDICIFLIENYGYRFRVNSWLQHADVGEHPFVTSSLRFPGVALHLLKKGNVELNVFHHNVAISNCFLARSCTVRDWCQIPPVYWKELKVQNLRPK